MQRYISDAWVGMGDEGWKGCVYLHCYGPPVSVDVMALLKIEQNLETGRRPGLEIVAL